MEVEGAPVAKAEMLIRRPVAEVFEAFVDPAITSRFWVYEGKWQAGRGQFWSSCMKRARTIGLVVVALVFVFAVALVIVLAKSDVELVKCAGKDMEPTIGKGETILISRRVGTSSAAI